MKEGRLTIPVRMEESAFLYQIPEDYFFNFPEALMQDILLMEGEEKILNISRTNPYDLIPNYFQNFTEQVLQLINLDYQKTDLVLNNLGKQIPFSIPENYFESLEIEILKKCILESAEYDEPELSPLLEALKNKQVFDVPDEYFSKPKGKTIVFKPKTAQKSIKWMRWAAAAMVVAIFSLGGWQFLNNNTINTNTNYATVIQGINQISDADIKEYLNATLNDYDVAMLAQNIDWDNKTLDGIPKSELKKYLDEGAY